MSTLRAIHPRYRNSEGKNQESSIKALGSVSRFDLGKHAGRDADNDDDNETGETER